MLSMAGIPPLAGFMAKFFLFSAAIDAGYLWIAVLGFVLSMVSVYYYLNVVKYLYLAEPPSDEPFQVGLPIRLAVIVAMTGTVILGVFPAPVAKVAAMAAKTLFN